MMDTELNTTKLFAAQRRLVLSSEVLELCCASLDQCLTAVTLGDERIPCYSTKRMGGGGGGGKKRGVG